MGWKKWNYWLKGAIVGVIVFIGLFIYLWLYSSFNFNCLLEPIQVINVGGPDCHFKNYISILSLIAFGLPIIIGFILGSIIGWIYGKVKK